MPRSVPGGRLFRMLVSPACEPPSSPCERADPGGGVNVLTTQLWSERASPLPSPAARVWAQVSPLNPCRTSMRPLLSHNHTTTWICDSAALISGRSFDVTPLATMRSCDALFPASACAGDCGSYPDRQGCEVTIVPAYHCRLVPDATADGAVVRLHAEYGAGTPIFRADTGYGSGHIFPTCARIVGRIWP